MDEGEPEPTWSHPAASSALMVTPGFLVLSGVA